MLDKFSRSWSLTRQCLNVLQEDPALLIFPVLSTAVLLLVMGSFALPVLALYHSGLQPFAGDDSSTSHTGRLMFYIVTYAFYVVSYTVMMFFNSALISVALKRLDGESAGVSDGLRMAWDNFPAILGYALVAATVGTILRAVEERVGLIGRIVVGLIGAGWTLATAMTLPILVEEDVGPFEAISRSLDLLKRNWGENLIGNGGISLGIALLALPIFALALILCFGAASSGSPIVGVGLMVVTAVLVGLVSTTLHSIYTAALYRFATGAKDNAGIDGALLAGAYRQK